MEWGWMGCITPRRTGERSGHTDPPDPVWSTSSNVLKMEGQPSAVNGPINGTIPHVIGSEFSLLCYRQSRRLAQRAPATLDRVPRRRKSNSARADWKGKSSPDFKSMQLSRLRKSLPSHDRSTTLESISRHLSLWTIRHLQKRVRIKLIDLR